MTAETSPQVAPCWPPSYPPGVGCHIDLERSTGQREPNGGIVHMLGPSDHSVGWWEDDIPAGDEVNSIPYEAYLEAKQACQWQ